MKVQQLINNKKIAGKFINNNLTFVLNLIRNKELDLIVKNHKLSN
jgi:hypothetical protein